MPSADPQGARTAAKSGLSEAVIEGDAVALREMIAAGADVNAAGEDRCTPLLLASEHGHEDMARSLIDSGADVDRRDRDGYSAVELAIHYQHSGVARLLIERNCDIHVGRDGFTLMHAAAARGVTSVGRLLQAKGLPLEAVDDGGRTPLHWAAQEGKVGFATWLISQGVALDAEDMHSTPLIIAVGEGHTAFAELLIKCGADVNYTTTLGTPLCTAFAWNRLRIVDLLVEAGARLDLRDKEGRYPIWFAVEYGRTRLLRKYAPRYRDILSHSEAKRLIKLASKRGVMEIVRDALSPDD